MKGLHLRWPTLPSRLVRDLLAGHSAIGLALGGLIYLVCLTGTLCVFIDELQLWETPAPAPAAFYPADSDRLVAEAVRLAGGPAKAPLIYLRAPVTPRERTTVSVGARQWTPAADGRLVPMPLRWTAFLAELHYNLSLPGPWGEIVVGMLGMSLLSLLISGVLAHPRILRDAFLLRLGGARRLQEADLHNRLGVWGLPFHLAVTATGALFGLANLLFLLIAAFGFHGDTASVYRVLAGPVSAADARSAPPPPLAQAVSVSRALRPGSRLYYLSVTGYGTKGAQVTVEMTAPGRLTRGEDTYFDSRGKLVGRTRYASGDLGLQLYSGAAQVHFGFWGGLPVRLAYGVLGWALTWVCAGGVSIWLARRRDQARPAPRLETLWSATVWGAPTALALASLTPAPALTFWITSALMLTSSQVPPLARWTSKRADRFYRGVLGCALLTAAISRAPGSIANSTGIVVEFALTTAVLGLALSLRGRLRKADALTGPARH